MNDLARLSQRLFNVPLMIRPEKAEIIAAALADRIGLAQIESIDGTSMGVLEMRENAAAAADKAQPREISRTYEVEDGIAMLTVEGSLVQKLSGANPRSGMQGYNQIRRKVADARADNEVKGIFVEYDSPGGEVPDCFELAKEIAAGSARNGGKPIYAYIGEQSCSASYMLTAPCDAVIMPETGVVGSIGVWTMIVDYTKALKKGGISAQMIRAGDRKARGGPFETADQATIDKLMNWVEATRQIFAGHVARFRDLEIADVLGQEGDWFYGEDAMETGLIDAIGNRSQALTALREAARV
jgi:signal peptide peptidase SppA